MFRQELSALRKGKSVEVEPEPTPTPPSTVPPPHQEVELGPDEMRQLLTATLLSRTDLREDEVNLLRYLQRSANLPPVSRPEPTTSTDVKEVEDRLGGKIDQSVEQLGKKIDDLKESVNSSLGTLETRVRAVETTCRAEAEPSKRRHDDEDDPSLREEEASKRQRLTEDRPPEASGTGGSGNLQGTGTETSTVPPQTEEAAVTSMVGRELVLYVDPDTLPLSTVQLCTDEEAREIINLDDYISDDDDEPLHEMFYSVKEEEEEAYTSEFETGAGSSGYEIYLEQPASVSPVVETTSTVSPPPQRVTPSSSSRTEPAPTTSTTGQSIVAPVTVHIKTEDVFAHVDQPFPLQPVFVHCDVPIN